jgi:hypothetical protein
MKQPCGYGPKRTSLFHGLVLTWGQVIRTKAGKLCDDRFMYPDPADPEVLPSLNCWL